MNLGNLILPLAIFGTGYVLFNKLIGGGKSEAQKEFEQGLDQIANEQKDKGEQLTFPAQQYRVFADQIYNALRFSALDDDKDQAETVLKKVVNTRDLIELIKAYGERQRYLFGFPDGPKTNLTVTVRDELSQSRITRVNQDYTSKGITLIF